MASIDERVVKLRMDTNQFEAGVSKTSGLLSKLKQSLNLKGSTKSFSELDSAVKSINFNPISAGANAAGNAFNALGSIGFSVMQRLTNAVIDTARSLSSTLTSGIRDGFAEYETQMNAVQTILSNTASKGSTLEDVNGALDDLNTYADKTIYNFTEMTRNIGTFTAAGVDLDTSTKAIKGIANLAAISGSSSQQASSAMYQLSQALATGKVSLQDWNSVVNAGMGGEVFQEALKRTSRQMGTGVDEAINKYGSFRDSLTEGQWLTADVLNETLKQISGAYTKEDLLAQGYTSDQAEQILQLAKNGEDAATKVKTFSQLIDTTKEAIGSGWTNTFEILIGNFEEAKELWTGVSDVISKAVNDSAQARNKMLQSWKDMGGRTALLDGLKKIFVTLGKVLSTVKQAFQEVFPPTTAAQLMSITNGFKFLATKVLFHVTAQLGSIKSIARGVFSVFSIGISVIKAIGTAISTAFGKGDGTLGFTLLSWAAKLGDFLFNLDQSIKKFGLFDGAAKTVGNALGSVINVLGSGVSNLSSFGSAISNVASSMTNGLGKAFDWIVNKAKELVSFIGDNFSAGDLFAGLAGGGLFIAAKKIGSTFDTIKEKIDGLFGKGGKDAGSVKKWSDSLKNALENLSGALESFTGSVKAFTLVEIAASIAVLVHSMKTIAELDATDIAKGITTIGALMTELNLSFKSISKTLNKMDTKGILKSGAAMLVFAKAIDILADAMTTIGKLSWSEIARGLTGMGGAMAELIVVTRGLSGVKFSIKTAASILVISKSLSSIAKALGEFAVYSWDQIAHGLVAMGGALSEIGVVTGALGKFAGASSLFASGAIFITAQGLSKIGTALGTFGSYDWSTIGHGLVAMGGALSEIGIVTGALGKFAGISGLFASGSIYIVAQGLSKIAKSFGTFGTYDWSTIGHGLVAMGGALSEIGIVSGALGKFAGLSGILGAGTISIVTDSLKDLAIDLGVFGSYDWSTIGTGLTAMAGALLVVGGMSTAVGKIAGLSGILGAGTIAIVTNTLDQLAAALERFGAMSWSTIGQGLVAMAGALLVAGGMSTAIGMIGGLAAVLGAGTISIVVSGLDQLASALAKFGAMDWGTIGRGIVAMVGAMGAAGLGALLNTFSGFGANTIATYAGPLGTLADSVKKWQNVTVPSGLGSALGSLASGVGKFTLGGWGASTLAQIPTPLGQLATAISKWGSITVPANIGSQLSSLASGVKSFTFGGFGADVMATVVNPVRSLAGAVKAWTGVTVPANIGSQLSNLASGVKSFTLGGFGADAMSSAAAPLRSLAGAVRAWSTVTVPTDLGPQLKTLSSAINGFNGVNPWGLSSVAPYLSQFATGCRNVISASPGNAAAQISAFVSNVNAAGALTSTLPTQLSSFAGQMAGSISRLASTISVGSSTITSGFSSLRSGVSASLSGISSTVNTAMNNMTSSVNSGKSRVVSAISQIPSSISGKTGSFRSAGSSLTNALLEGLRSNTGKFSGVFTNALNNAANSARGGYQQFYSAGQYSASGFAAGIRSAISSAASAAAELAASASSAAKENLKIKSPSRVFMKIGDYVVQGFANGITNNDDKAASAAKQMSKAAIASVQSMALDDLNISPTITPVMDLDNIQNGIKSMNALMQNQENPKASNNRMWANTAASSYSRIQSRVYGNGDVINAVDRLSDLIESGSAQRVINNYEFTQNNTSPKALDAIDIYRQTKSAMSRLKNQEGFRR